MKVILNNKYNFNGIVNVNGDRFLRFQEIKFPDTYVLVKRAKFVDVLKDTVQFLQV